MNSYKIDKDILKWILLNRAENIIPMDCLNGKFNLENLLGLGYFYTEGCIQHTEGYVKTPHATKINMTQTDIHIGSV